LEDFHRTNQLSEDIPVQMGRRRLRSGSLSVCMLAFAVISLSAAAQTTAQNEWTWMGGSSTVGTGGVVPGVYGTLGTPAPGNIPGSRVGAASWTDSSGHLWLFGGEGFGASGAVDFLNDLWEFNPSTNQWSWMGGTSTPERQCVDNQGEILCGQSGVYGTLGTAAPENFPGGRSNAVSWTDKSGDLWLYGGGGWDSAGQDGVLNDLWEFNPAINQWTWIGGSSTIPANFYGRPGVYGTMGTPAAGNDPGALVYAFSWTDERGNSWLFGGWGYDVNDENGLPNNLWKFDASVGEWAWIEGSPAYDTPWVHPSVYGTKGIPTSGNIPGSRWQGSAWTDNNGNLWLFGGQGYDLQGNSGFLNELWEFDPITNQWAWMAGQSVMTCGPNSQQQNCGNAGVYGTLGTPSPGNLPGGRSQQVGWRDNAGHFWLFGGSGFNANGGYGILNDLWEFDQATNGWRWMGGNSGAGSGAGVYGTVGVPSAANMPGSRHGAVSWVDQNGNFWLFGGNALDATGNIGLPNDMWVYQPYTANFAAPDFSIATSPKSMTLTAGQSSTTAISITPANGFNSAVTFSCSGLPSGASCSFSPATVTPAGTAATTTLTLTAATKTAVLDRKPGPLFPGSVLAVALCSFGWKRRRHLQIFLLLAVGVIGVGMLNGCGGGGSASGAGGSGSQPVTSTITVTAMSGSLQHSATISLTVD
jgi:N-acetylneuraminic acid mutarotase